MIRGSVSDLKQAVIGIRLRGVDGTLHDVDAAINTGFDGYLTLTPEVIARLQFPYLTSRVYELGDGDEVEFAVHEARVLWDGHDRTVEALVTNGGILVGMGLLTGYHVSMDVVDGGEVVIRNRRRRLAS